MIEFEITNPENGFLLGFEFVKGTTEDLEEGETTEVNIISLGIGLFKLSYLWV